MKILFPKSKYAGPLVVLFFYYRNSSCLCSFNYMAETEHIAGDGATEASQPTEVASYISCYLSLKITLKLIFLQLAFLIIKSNRASTI